jgi:hypothetical protein
MSALNVRKLWHTSHAARSHRLQMTSSSGPSNGRQSSSNANSHGSNSPVSRPNGAAGTFAFTPVTKQTESPPSLVDDDPFDEDDDDEEIDIDSIWVDTSDLKDQCVRFPSIIGRLGSWYTQLGQGHALGAPAHQMHARRPLGRCHFWRQDVLPRRPLPRWHHPAAGNHYR